MTDISRPDPCFRSGVKWVDSFSVDESDTGVLSGATATDHELGVSREGHVCGRSDVECSIAEGDAGATSAALLGKLLAPSASPSLLR